MSANNNEPDFITVQHILIGFDGSLPGTPIPRNKDEAKTLAESLVERAQGGEDFDALVLEFTDDSHPGIYSMANLGVDTSKAPQDLVGTVYARNGMVPAFGNAGFPLDVDQIGLAAHDPAASPYGWHVVKRIK